MKNARLAEAEAEYEKVRNRLRRDLIAIQTARIDAALKEDVANVRSEVDWLLGEGRIRLAQHVLTLVESLATAKVNLEYAASPEAQAYATVVDGPTVEYLESDP